MKKLILLLIVASAFTANGQSLKDALYGGKLKLDSGKVVKQGDDWKSRIDTSTKKPVEKEVVKSLPLKLDAAGGVVIAEDSVTVQADSAVSIVAGTDPDAVTATPAAPATPDATKDNNKVWKQFMDELTGALRTEVMPNKKIKSGTYSVLIEYEIGIDGQVTATNVSASPENSFLEQQVKERITLTSPQLTPLLNNFGKPRKAAKKQMLTIAK